MAFDFTKSLRNIIAATSDDVMDLLEEIKTWLNGNNYLTSPLTGAGHGNLSSTTSILHTAISIAYANAKVTGTTLKAAVDELVTFLQYDSSDPTKRPEKKIGYEEDNTVYTAVSGAGSYSAGSLKVTVPANAAATKLVVKWGAYVSVNGAAGGAISLFVPLRIGTTDLSAAGGQVPSYHILHGYSGDSGASATCPMRSTEITSPTIDLTVANDVSIGTIFATIAGGASLAQLSNMWIEVYAI